MIPVVNMASTASADGSIRIGDIIGGRYRVEALIGRGGMAMVYKVRHTATDKPCALKLVHAHLVAQPQIVELLLREAQLGARIGQSPYIVDIFDAGFDEARRVPFLVMELLQGETLDRLAAERGPLPPEIARVVFEQLADALDQAHRAGVVHRDLKPTNLFLTWDRAGKPCLKVMDFGIAKVLEIDAHHTATQVGTPAYAAPEQMGATLRKLAARQGIVVAPHVSPATDVWAIGLVAYDVLTGLPPGQFWGVEAATELPTKVVLDDHDPPSIRAGDRAHRLPPGFDAWFARCTHKDAAKRWPSAGQAIAELARLLPTSSDPSRASSAAWNAPRPALPSFAAQPDTEALHTIDAKTIPLRPALRPAWRLAIRPPRRGELLAALGVAVAAAAIVTTLALYRSSHIKKLLRACADTVARCDEACDAGDAASCAKLGAALERGEGLPRDEARAQALYDRACTAGHMHSCAALGVMLTSLHPGTAEDSARAVALYRKACDGGDILGCLHLGAAYEAGRPGLKRDEARAAGLYQIACDGNEALGCLRLGAMVEAGRGGQRRDEARAVTLYTRACEGGEALGCTSLGWLHETGRAGQRDEARAATFYSKACDADEALGCTRLGAMLEEGRASGPKDEARAAKLFRKACEASEMNGCLRLAAIYEVGRGGEVQDEVAAAALYQRACDNGEALACARLAAMIETERGGLGREPQRAAALYRRACDGGVAHGCSALGWLEIHGRGVARDRERGLEHLRRGCDAGDEWGCDRQKESTRSAPAR